MSKWMNHWRKRKDTVMASLGLILQIPLFTLPFLALGPWKLASMDQVTQAPSSSSFWWVWPMREGRGSESQEERAVWAFISLSPCLPGHKWQGSCPSICIIPSVGLSLLDRLNFYQALLLFLISGPRMVSASCFGPRPAVQSLVGPLQLCPNL